MRRLLIVSCILAAQAPVGSGAYAATPADATAPAAASAAAAAAPAVKSAEAEKVVRALINAIRYQKDGMALAKLASTAMSERLMQPEWQKLDNSQRLQFVHDLEGMLVATSFERGREMFQYLDAVLFAPVKKVGNELHVQSTVVVHRELKKAQIPIEWVLINERGALRVVDIINQGDSTAQGIREEEVVPLLKEGGPTLVVDTLHRRLAEVTLKAKKTP